MPPALPNAGPLNAPSTPAAGSGVSGVVGGVTGTGAPAYNAAPGGMQAGGMGRNGFNSNIMNTATVPLHKGGLLRVVSNADLENEQAIQDAQKGAEAPVELPHGIAAYIRNLWEIMRKHRSTTTEPMSDRLLKAQRMFDGRYDPTQLAAIQQFGGTEVYSRMVAQKCRGASSLLRDVYLGPDRPWDIQPEPDPPVPPDVQASIFQLVSAEVQTQRATNQPVLEDQAHARIQSLMHAAQQAARENCMQQAKDAADRMEDILVTGRFYTAMAEFLVDLPLFPFACLKGPVVRMVPKMTWTADPTSGRQVPSMQNKPQMFWDRVSPFDLYWSPGAAHIEDADIIERTRYTRHDLNMLIGVPGYDEGSIRTVLDEYGRGGLMDWIDGTDSERAANEGRENPQLNQSAYITALEFHGRVQGRILIESGMTALPGGAGAGGGGQIDELLDYSIQAWIIGRYAIKLQLNPSPRQRHPYYVTSFEKVPGTVAGHGLPEILEDLQESKNATLRALINNMAMSSGPQVVVDDELCDPTNNTDQLYPWKVWHLVKDPLTSDSQARQPVTFFQPDSNAQELMQVMTQIDAMADEASGIPRYITGSQNNLGGAGRTASGLSMLMGNAEKILQTVASNIDGDIMLGGIQGLYELVMLTDNTGMLTGNEDIRVRGVNVAVQQETERAKQLQFLQITGNPIDFGIIGEIGRARVLRSVAGNMGLPDDVVPDDRTLQQKQAAQQQIQQAGAMGQPGGPGGPPAPPVGPNGKPLPPGAPGGQGAPSGASVQPPPPPGTPTPSGGPSPGAAAQGNQAPFAAPSSPSDVAPPMNSFQQG